MGKTEEGKIVFVKKPENTGAEENPQNNNGGGQEPTTEKIHFMDWVKHPIKTGKIFNERHPRVKWVVGGVATVALAVGAAFLQALSGDRCDENCDGDCDSCGEEESNEDAVVDEGDEET